MLRAEYLPKAKFYQLLDFLVSFIKFPSLGSCGRINSVGNIPNEGGSIIPDSKQSKRLGALLNYGLILRRC